VVVELLTEAITMKTVAIESYRLEYEVYGAGEPAVLIHGSVLADTYLPMLSEPSLSNFKLVRYRRRGFGNSTHPASIISLSDQANDCWALMRELNVARAHIAGHSYGGVIALQLALDHPEAVHSLALLEPALVGFVAKGAEFRGALAPVIETHQNGDRRGALEGFFLQVAGPDWRRSFDVLPGSLEMALADIDNLFRVEIPAMGEWRFTRDDRSRIHQPVLAVVGGESAPVFHEIQELVQSWFPQARPVTIPGTNHMLQAVEPRALAEVLASFWKKVPMH
jgi:pimeloyl-ACP methyl ester carboxylesterase